MPLRLRLLPSPGGAPDRGPTAERTIELADDAKEIRIGRRPDVEVPLPYPALSGLHARLVRTSAGWSVEDMGSTNGTRVDGQPLTAGQPRAIAPGSQIVLGHVSLVFDGSKAAVSGAERTTTIARRLVNDLFSASPGQGAPTLTIVTGAPARPTVRLEKIDEEYVAGRTEACALQLASEEVSREHAVFVRLWDGVVVKDLGSKNGVRVNDQLSAERRLRDGDLIQIGPAVLRFLDPADRYLREFEARLEADAPVAPSGAARRTEPAPRVAEPAEPAVARGAAGARTAIGVAGAVLLLVALAVLALVLWR